MPSRCTESQALLQLAARLGPLLGGLPAQTFLVQFKMARTATPTRDLDLLRTHTLKLLVHNGPKIQRQQLHQQFHQAVDERIVRTEATSANQLLTWIHPSALPPLCDLHIIICEHL